MHFYGSKYDGLLFEFLDLEPELILVDFGVFRALGFLFLSILEIEGILCSSTVGPCASAFKSSFFS